jgi:hypothetical protein
LNQMLPLQPDELDVPKRSLLAAEHIADSAFTLSTSEYVSKAAQGMLPAAEFVCNRTACIALTPEENREATGLAPQPLALRKPTRSGQEELDGTMMSALKELAPIALQMCSSQDAPARSPPLRGAGQLALPARLLSPPCGADGCAGFDRLADKAMSGAGLIAPGTCRLVYDSAAHRRQTQRGTHTRHEPKVPRQPVEEQAANGENGFVILNEGKPQAPRVVDALQNGADRNKIVIASDVLEYHSHNDGPGEDHGSDGAGEGRHDFGGGQVVSVLLPVKKGDAEKEGVLTALRHLYVVTMKPSERFLTYECALSRPLFV